MKKTRVNTIVVSDLHLGSPRSQASKLIPTIQKWDFQKMIIVGDTLNGKDISHLSLSHKHLLEFLLNVSKKKQVVWIEGNHDQYLRQAIPGIKSSYHWHEKAGSFLALHGQQFDPGIPNNFFQKKAADWVNNLGHQLRLNNYYDTVMTILTKLNDKVAQGAVVQAKEVNSRYVVCGHTHKIEERNIEGVHYFNLGSWITAPAILTIGDSVTLHRV